MKKIVFSLTCIISFLLLLGSLQAFASPEIPYDPSNPYYRNEKGMPWAVYSSAYTYPTPDDYRILLRTLYFPIWSTPTKALECSRTDMAMLHLKPIW